MKRKKKYVTACIAKEFRSLWIMYVAIAFLVFGFLIYYSLERDGTVLGLSNITTSGQLEKFFMRSDNRGRLHADSVFTTGLQVDLTESEKRNLNFQVGGAYVETPSITVSTYDRTYDIYAAVLDDSVVIVLAGYILNQSQAGLQYCDVIELNNEDIGGKQKLIDALIQEYPDFFGQFRHIYLAKGRYPENLLKPIAVILAIFVLAAALLYGLPYFYPVRKFSYIGRQITKLAKAEGRTFKEMCERLNEYADGAFYKNGLELLSARYVVLMERSRPVMGTQERMKVYSLDSRYEVPYIRNITIMDSTYPDEMNDVNITTDERKHHHLTVHKTRQEVEDILAKMGFSEIT
ncbi:MAG: hypothetical protein NC086_05250 [Alistipes sp.]|nr:hypothetical protein [Alistipes sp.]